MARGILVATLLVLAAGTLWLLLDESTGKVKPARELESEGTDPGLTGGGQVEEDEAAPLPEIEDPVDYVLSSLRAISSDERRAHLLALIEADPDFLQGLIDWIATPDNRPMGPPGLQTTDTAEAAIQRVLVLIGEPAVAPLVTLLAEGHRDARCQAARVLQALGPTAEQAVEPLVQAARSEEEDRYVRAAAIDALGAIGASSRGVLPLLHTTLADPDCEEEIGLACARNLLPIGGPTDEVFATCRRVLSGDWYEASATLLKGLAGFGSAARPFVPDLLRLFDDPETEEGLWSEVAPVLQSIGDDGDKVLFFLEEMIRTSREEGVGDGGAALALAGVGTRGQQRLLKVAAPGSATERLRVLQLLHGAGQDSAQLVGHVAQFLRAADPGFRVSALQLLAQLQAPAAKVLPILRPYLEGSDDQVRAEALRALGYATEPSRAAVDILQQHAAGKSEYLALTALAALEEVAPAWPDAALSVFLTALKDPRKQVVWSTTAHLAKLIKVRRKQVVGAWLAGLQDPRIAQMAAMSLMKHAADDPRAQKAFRSMIASPSARLRMVAVHALGKSAKARDFEALLSRVRDADPRLRSSALSVLGGYATRYGERVVDACIAALSDEHEWPRQSAAQALGKLGAQGARAIPALEKAGERCKTNPLLAHRIRRAIEALTQAVERH